MIRVSVGGFGLSHLNASCVKISIISSSPKTHTDSRVGIEISLKLCEILSFEPHRLVQDTVEDVSVACFEVISAILVEIEEGEIDSRGLEELQYDIAISTWAFRIGHVGTARSDGNNDPVHQFGCWDCPQIPFLLDKRCVVKDISLPVVQVETIFNIIRTYVSIPREHQVCRNPWNPSYLSLC